MRCDLQEGLPDIPSMRKRLEIALDVAKALQYLHAEELIHRDVKMQNVLVSTATPVSINFKYWRRRNGGVGPGGGWGGVHRQAAGKVPAVILT